jgi:hypothetical protein
MLLDTFLCSTPGCDNTFAMNVATWHRLLFARDAGWTFSHDEEFAWCPEHGPESGVIEKWVVGCWTCDFEEEFDSEEAAKDEYSLHQCEADTWIRDPQKVRDMEARQAARRSVQTARVNATLSEAVAQQDRIEQYANRWLAIRNFFLPWKKEHITSQHPRKG